MEMIFCPNCNKLTGYKRVIGFGTFFAVLLTAGFWLLALPFYPKRCITCGLGKSESVSWTRTWRAPALAGIAIIVLVILYGYVSDRFIDGRHGLSKNTVEQMRADLVPYGNWYHTMQLGEMRQAERRVFGARVAEIEHYMTGSGQWAGTDLAVIKFCKPHDCGDHGGVFSIDVSTGRAAGELRSESEVIVYLGDYGNADELPSFLKSEVEGDSSDVVSRRNVVYVH